MARSRSLPHPSGIAVETPLLVPSFSSKGFRVTKDRSEVRDVVLMASEYLTESMLVSAYDLHHGHVPRPDEMPGTPELIVVDSGGYELGVEHDLSTVVHSPHQPLSWNQDLYREELDKWPGRFAAILVSYDEPQTRMSVVEQIAAARESLGRYTGQLQTFLLKPETKGQKFLDDAIKALSAVVADLSAFHFLGVTEKELGSTLRKRMLSVARLRLMLDDAGVSIPIHIFGALDPLTSVLYFLAGAEVFDGLTWLRFAFWEGRCVYPANYGAIRVGTWERDDHVRARILADNVIYLRKMADVMKRFVLDRDFGKFGEDKDFLAAEVESLQTKVEGAR